VIIICVPTPLRKTKDPDVSYILAASEKIQTCLRPGQLVILESTTYPGTTDEELKPRIESRGFEVGKDIFLCFSPEREDPGNADYSTRTIPKVCGGSTPACLEAGLALYGGVIDRVVPVLPQASNRSACFPALDRLDRLRARNVPVRRRPPHDCGLIAGLGTSRLDAALLNPFALRDRRRRFPTRGVTVVLRTLGAVATPVRRVVAILSRERRARRARKENEQEKLTHPPLPRD